MTSKTGYFHLKMCSPILEKPPSIPRYFKWVAAITKLSTFHIQFNDGLLIHSTVILYIAQQYDEKERMHTNLYVMSDTHRVQSCSLLCNVGMCLLYIHVFSCVLILSCVYRCIPSIANQLRKASSVFLFVSCCSCSSALSPNLWI